MELKINADGGCYPNPGGLMRIGVIARDSHNALVKLITRVPGRGTCNVAEWLALIEALQYAVDAGCTTATIQMDSQLVVHQANRRWRVKSAHLQRLAKHAFRLLHVLRANGCAITIIWIPREENQL